MVSKIDYSIVGKKFGKLTVEEFAYQKNKNSYWKCRCDCGNYKVVFRGGLTSGDIISCGCYREEHKNEFGKKHGMSHSKIYKKWAGMCQRCHNKKSSKYYMYGARGIKVCDEWRRFEPFYEWAMNNGYRDDLSIDRIDNNGNYEPNNCRWVTRETQQNNTRRNHYVTYNGMRKTITEWSRVLGINHETLRYKVKNGNFKVFEILPYSELITGEEHGTN